MKKVATRYTIYLIIGIIVVFAVIVGGTYAIFRRSTAQDSANIVSTLDCIDVSITGNTAALTLNNAYPLTDKEGTTQTPYRFTVKNNCDTFVQYQIVMSVVNTSTITNKEYVKIDLDGLKSNRKKKISELIEEPQAGLTGYLNNYTLINSSFNGDESHVYNFRMWLNGENEEIWEDETTNQSLTVKLSIIGVTKTDTEEPTLKDKILGVNNANVTTSLTEPGKQVSISEEAVLASAEDDYGTSYYFRGAVENNYIMFADMCWRIVRVAGDGSIKLVLYNYNKGENSCGEVGASNAFASYDGATYTTAFNTDYNYNAYVGFMYGTPGSNTYAAEHANTTKSTILSNLETWYTDNLASHESQLADTIWCNDKSIDTKYPYGTILGYGTNQTGYSARGRIYADNTMASNAAPTLKCPDDSNGGKLSKFTVEDTINGNGNLAYKIGLLTADEVAFAGGMYGASNITYYLNQNASGATWWSLSPHSLGSSGSASMWGVDASGGLGDVSAGNAFGLRPAVSLKSTITVAGSGTSEDPYKIIEEPTIKDKILAQEGGPATIEAKGTPPTSPGKEISTTGEQGLFATEDDYGTSYYYRGAVGNNYVLFADMCWRIVRVTGDGSIKLVLYNYNKGASSCSGTGASYAFARYDGATYTTAFNTDYNNNAYVGFKYGSAGSGTYAAEHANTNKSTILTNLETWYTNNLASYANKLADTIWCNDKSTVSLGSYGTLGYGTNQTAYNALKRLGYNGSSWDHTTAAPTLKCPNDKNGGKLSKFTVADSEGNASLTYKIGLLTIDEAAYAGGMQGTENTSYYLNQNATDNHMWSLSPNVFNGSYADVCIVSSAGYLYSDIVNDTLGLRPAVSLNSATQVTGAGTSEDPYIVID